MLSDSSTTIKMFPIEDIIKSLDSNQKLSLKLKQNGYSLTRRSAKNVSFYLQDPRFPVIVAPDITLSHQHLVPQEIHKYFELSTNGHRTINNGKLLFENIFVFSTNETNLVVHNERHSRSPLNHSHFYFVQKDGGVPSYEINFLSFPFESFSDLDITKCVKIWQVPSSDSIKQTILVDDGSANWRSNVFETSRTSDDFPIRCTRIFTFLVRNIEEIELCVDKICKFDCTQYAVSLPLVASLFDDNDLITPTESGCQLC